jgi:competence protein ComEA
MSSKKLQSESDRLEVVDPDKIKRHRKKFNLEEFLYGNRVTVTLFLLGAILLGFGFFYIKKSNLQGAKIEVLDKQEESGSESLEIVVEIVGAVEKPNVYRLDKGARVEDLLIAAGGIAANADREWIEKFINKASKLSDGQKLYIPRAGDVSNNVNEQLSESSAKDLGVSNGVLGSQGSGNQNMVNINTSTQNELESLWGIGPVTAQNIIEHRPYSTIEELLTKKILKRNVYERNKDLLTIY